MSIPKCAKCAVEQPWLLSVNSQVVKLTYECNECGWQQSVVVE